VYEDWYILLTCGEDLHDLIISLLRGEIFTHKTKL